MLFAVKNYGIQRSIKYKILESNHVKYHSKCKHFGNGCTLSMCYILPEKGVVGNSEIQQATYVFVHFYFPMPSLVGYKCYLCYHIPHGAS